MHLLLHRHQCANPSPSVHTVYIWSEVPGADFGVKKPPGCTDPLVTSDAEEATNETRNAVDKLIPSQSNWTVYAAGNSKVSLSQMFQELFGPGKEGFICLMGANNKNNNNNNNVNS